MGEFLAVSALHHRDVPEAVDAIHAYLASFDVQSLVASGEPVDARRDALLFRSTNDWTVVLWPYYFTTCDIPACVSISAALRAIVSTIHVHDDDYWTHLLMQDGRILDRFCSYPTMFVETPEEQQDIRVRWRGNAQQIGNLLSVPAARIEPYLRQMDAAHPLPPTRVFNDDQFTLDNFWVFVDFWRQLGISYPADLAAMDAHLRLDANWLDKLPQEDEL